MTQPVFFVSDIHFGAESPAKEFNKRRLLDHFLNEIVLPVSNELYIIGDLFDFWFEYKNVVLSEHHEVIRILSNAVQKGLQIHYVAGNHDFWIGPYLTDQVGMTIYPDPKYVMIDGHRFYLCHGDGVAKRDVGYRILKKILRSNINIRLYRWLHPDLGVPLAKWVSGSSRKYTNNIDLQDHDDYLEFAKSHIRDGGAEFVVMGHRHNPLRHSFESGGVYLNLGDWLFNFTYGRLNDGNLQLLDLKAQMAKYKAETDAQPELVPEPVL